MKHRKISGCCQICKRLSWTHSFNFCGHRLPCGSYLWGMGGNVFRDICLNFSPMITYGHSWQCVSGRCEIPYNPSGARDLKPCPLEILRGAGDPEGMTSDFPDFSLSSPYMIPPYQWPLGPKGRSFWNQHWFQKSVIQQQKSDNISKTWWIGTFYVKTWEKSFIPSSSISTHLENIAMPPAPALYPPPLLDPLLLGEFFCGGEFAKGNFCGLSKAIFYILLYPPPLWYLPQVFSPNVEVQCWGGWAWYV